MRVFSHGRLALGLLLLAGCADSAANLPEEAPGTLPGPHGGTAYRMPQHLGYVELTNDPDVDPRTEGPTSIVASFLGNDGKQPMTGTPSDIVFQVEVSRDPILVPLKPSNEGAKQFASEQGPYNLKMIRGTLSGKIDGKDFQMQVSSGR